MPELLPLRLQLGQGRWPPKEKRERAFALWRSRLAQIERTREKERVKRRAKSKENAMERILAEGARILATGPSHHM